MWKWIAISAMSAMMLSAGPNRELVRLAAVPDSQILHQVQPAYPEDARDAHVQGVVRIRLMIAKDGHVEQARLVSGNRLLAPAALQAARQRVYKPIESEGKVVRVITEIEIPFTLP